MLTISELRSLWVVVGIFPKQFEWKGQCFSRSMKPRLIRLQVLHLQIKPHDVMRIQFRVMDNPGDPALSCSASDEAQIQGLRTACSLN